MTPPTASRPPETAASRRPRSPRGEGARLRDEILDAAETMLLDTGSSAAVSIRAVADAVGVTPPSIYRHFPDKNSLIYEVCDRRCATLDEAFATAVAGIDDPVEGLRALGRAYVEFGLDNPEPYRLVFMSRIDDDTELFTDDRLPLIAFGRAVEWVQAAIDGGHLRPQHTDAFQVATTVWAHAHGLVSLLITKPGFPWPDADGFVAEYLESALRGLLAPEAGA